MMLRREQIRDSLSDLTTHYPLETYNKILPVMTSYISQIKIIRIKYSFVNAAIDFPLMMQEGVVRSSYERFLEAYRLDLKERGTIKNLDQTKQYVAEKTGRKSLSLTIGDLNESFKFVINDSKSSFFQKLQGESSNVEKYLSSIAASDVTIFEEYAKIYKKTHVDSVPLVEGENSKEIFRRAFKDLSTVFNIEFVENNNDFQLVVQVKSHLRGLRYDDHGQYTSMFELYVNNFYLNLLAKLQQRESFPIQILINNEEFELTKKWASENVKFLEYEVALHESLHVLGIQHPIDEEMRLHQVPKSKFICTIMESNSDNRYSKGIFFRTLGPNDIVALEAHGYNVNTTTYAGDTVYMLGAEGDSETYKQVNTLVDRDGTNTLDTTSYQGENPVYLDLAYGCVEPSKVGNQFYFLDYQSKFTVVKTGNAPHRIHDKTTHDLDITLGQGKTQLYFYSLKGNKVVRNFDKSKDKFQGSPKVEYSNDKNDNCVGHVNGSDNFSITFIDNSCENLGIAGDYQKDEL
jgi:hypothetical protein